MYRNGIIGFITVSIVALIVPRLCCCIDLVPEAQPVHHSCCRPAVNTDSSTGKKDRKSIKERCDCQQEGVTYLSVSYTSDSSEDSQTANQPVFIGQSTDFSSSDAGGAQIFKRGPPDIPIVGSTKVYIVYEVFLS